MAAMLDRRTFLGCCGALALAGGLRWFSETDFQRAAHFEIEKTDDEWQRLLTKAQYEVLRLRHTEAPGTSPLNHEARDGVFCCAGCDLPLFSSGTSTTAGPAGRASSGRSTAPSPSRPTTCC